MTERLRDQSLPLDAAALRRLMTRRTSGNRARFSREDITRVLMRTDAQLIAMAQAVNQGLKRGDSVNRITGLVVDLGVDRAIDENVVRAFLRAVGLELRCARQSNWARYHQRKAQESVELGRSAYTHKRGPAQQYEHKPRRREPVEFLDFDDDYTISLEDL